MFKVIEFYVRAFAVSEGAEGRWREPIGDVRRTRDEAQAQAWAQELRDRFARKGGSLGPGGQAHEVMVYSVVGEPPFDLWAEPKVRGRYKT